MTQALPPGDEYPLIGQTIANKYKIVRLLGEGGMGCVYMGEQQLGTTTRKVAVKTLHKHLSHDPSIKARFQREVGTVAALEHPNTIQVFDFGTMDDGTLYIVMEFVQGRSVADILEKDGAMPPARVANIMRQVIGSLEEAHNHGIVHRDLKPDNVILCERAGQKDWVEVLDFGIAKRSNEHDPNEAKLTQQGMVLGTPPYMSPEQFTGEPVDVRSDIYALGVMAYEMLTGRLPWVANTAWEWASKHMTEPPTPMERQPLGPNVPENMRNAINRALSKDKNDRFMNVRQFLDALGDGTNAGFAGSAAQAAGTSMLGAQGRRSAPPPAGPVSSGDGRVKTEMGAPMGGPPPAMMGGMGGIGGAPPPPQPYAGAAVPPGPVHAPEKKGGPPMLVIGLGALAALLLLGGGIAYAVSAKKKNTTTTTSIDLSSTSSSASASVAVDTTPPPDVTSAAPLDPGSAAVPLAQGPNTKAGTKTPATKPTPTPVPTPKPVTPDPPICAQARAEKTKGSPAKIVSVLESKCRAAGGTP
jgi:serine/threonine-protein kinase